MRLSRERFNLFQLCLKINFYGMEGRSNIPSKILLMISHQGETNQTQPSKKIL